MTLNAVWISLFFGSALFGIMDWVLGARPDVLTQMMNATFESAKNAFDVTLQLTGTLTLWLGFMRIGEKAGAVTGLAKVTSPIMKRIFPGVPAHHPALGAIALNFMANLLGLNNAATPAGLQAMRELQKLNRNPTTVSNDQAMFIVLHSASLTLIPMSIIAIRTQMGAAHPMDIFFPILFASFCSALCGFFSVALVQKNIRFRDPILLGSIVISLIAIGTALTFLSHTSTKNLESFSSQLGAGVFMFIILWFLGLATWNRIDAWEAFVDGAKDGFTMVVQMIPFLVGILVAVGVFRASGAMEWLAQILWKAISWTGLPQATVGAIPTLLIKPLSGSGARGMMIDAMKTYGVDSFTGRLASVINGSTDTTFYIIALYSGAVGLKNTRHVLPCSLLSDLAGLTGALFMAWLFFRMG